MVAFYRQESPFQRWKLFQRFPSTGPVGLTLTTISESREEHGTIIASVRDDTGLKSITVAHDGTGERSQTLSLSLTPGKIYDLELERREPLNPPPLHHYRLTSQFPALEIGWDRPLQSLEAVSSWSFNSDGNETARIRLFTDSPGPFGVSQATQAFYTIVRPNGGMIARDVAINGFPAEIVVPPDVSAAKILNLRANGHLRIEKVTGSDRGFYAIPCIPQPGHFVTNVPGGPFGIGPPPPQGQPGQVLQPSGGGSSDEGFPIAPVAGGGVVVMLAGFGAWLYFSGKRKSLAIQGASNMASTTANAPPPAATATVVQADGARTLGSGAQPTSQVIGSVTQASAGLPAPQMGSAPEPPPAKAAVPDAELTKPPPSGLSGREVEVILLIAKGYTNKQIAQELSISDATAKRHIENILRKLGLSTRTQVAIWATQNGYGNGNKPIASQ